jgi:hypothetical protein
VPASRKTRGRTDSGRTPGPVSSPNPAPVEESPGDDALVESRPHTEGKRARGAPARHRKQHGTAYRWFSAYLPVMGGLFVLLAALWVYTGFINPPPPTPAQQWTRIEDKWSPPREKARAAAAASTLDFAKQKAAYQDFYNQTKGWVGAVTAVSDWGVAADDVSSFESDGQGLLTVLQRAIDASTAYDVAGMAQQIADLDSTFTQDVVNVGQDLAIANSSPSAPPLAVPSVNETPTPVPSPTAGPSSSPGATGSPAASPTVSPVPSPTAS